ncbi:MAG TPA: alpha-galactosidase [Cytophagaceae bacterium]
MRFIKFGVLLLSLSASYNSLAQGNINYSFSQLGCKVELINNTLSVGNNLIRRTWKWNDGNIISVGLDNLAAKKSLKLENKLADLNFGADSVKALEGTIRAEFVPDSYQHNQHLKVSIQYKLNDLEIRKVLNVYPDCPAISTEIYLRGIVSNSFLGQASLTERTSNVEDYKILLQANKMPHVEELAITGKHWKVKAVEFFDATDMNNTLVQETKVISYWFDSFLRGNLLFAKNLETDAGFFFLKEAPNPKSQLQYPGGDFLAGAGKFRILGLGVDSADVSKETWLKAYGYTTGVYSGEEAKGTFALRKYQMLKRPLLRGRDEMIMLNTWGDRGKDTRVNEAFCLNELQLASRLGITHFQIDDGWQAGKSGNSAYGGSFKDIWSNPNYWKPDAKKFPNGLAPIVKKGKELGIEVCLWYNPSVQNNYNDWEKDALAILGLYKTYGIRTFKIDGLGIPNKASEVRLRMLFDRVMKESNWEIVLNLDATAGKRGGYSYFNEYGNFFLENRYTDWGNHYPYWTLRNLWMLSKYLPAQMFQIEFLNKWRNQGKYGDDRFAPAKYSFDYLFAISLMAQPLAWMEAANLPEEAFLTAKTIKKYRLLQHDLHQGRIFPIGEEPDGRVWCGFESLKVNKGYILVFREDNKEPSKLISTSLPPGKKVSFKSVLGDGKNFDSVVSKEGKVKFTLANPNSFAMYSYTHN